MKKLIVIAALLFGGRLLMAQAPYVKVDEFQTKYEQMTRQNGIRCHLADYDIATLYARLFHDMETSVRTVETDGSVRYFYRIFRKETKEKPAVEVFVAYEDFLEISDLLDSMMEEEREERNVRKDYSESFYRTEDGFQIGYYVKNRQTNWYIVMDRYGEEKVFFDSVSKLKDHFKKALAKFEEVKKKNGD